MKKLSIQPCVAEIQAILDKFIEKEAKRLSGKLQKSNNDKIRRLENKIESLKDDVEAANNDAEDAEKRLDEAFRALQAGQEYARYLGRELDKLQPPKEIGPNIFLLSENHKHLHNEQDKINANSVS